VVTLSLPPLRERGDDIYELAERLLERACHRLHKPRLAFSESALSAIRCYGWPGNVRELENAIERAVILSDGTEVTADLLAIDHESPTPVRPALSGRPAPAPAAPEEPDSSTLEDYFVRFVLDHEDHMTETEIAQRLGISRKSLWERRQRLDIPRKRTRNRGPRSTRSAATGSGGESR
jgi:DNA-binding NtrC family response regulator